MSACSFERGLTQSRQHCYLPPMCFMLAACPAAVGRPPREDLCQPTNESDRYSNTTVWPCLPSVLHWFLHCCCKVFSHIPFCSCFLVRSWQAHGLADPAQGFAPFSSQSWWWLTS